MKRRKCLKIINRKPKYSSNREIKEIQGYLSIQDMFDELYLKYIKRNLNNNNEIICDLFEEFMNFDQRQTI